MMRVTEIWRFPVKSMGGETLLDAEVTDLGIAGDRGWSVYDRATGTTLTARRTPELLFASARLVADELVVTLPDGSEVGEGGSERLSAWLGRDVELRAAGEHNLDAGGVYEVPLDAEQRCRLGELDRPRWGVPRLDPDTRLARLDSRHWATGIDVDSEPT